MHCNKSPPGFQIVRHTGKHFIMIKMQNYGSALLPSEGEKNQGSLSHDNLKEDFETL